MFGPPTEQHKKVISQAKKHLRQMLANQGVLDETIKMQSVLLESLIGSLSKDEVFDHNGRYWAEVAHHLFTFGKKRNKGESLIRAFNPDGHEFSEEARRTLVQLINDNMPFLVDSVSMACHDFGVDIQLLSHPVLAAKRDNQGRLLKLQKKAHKDGVAESWIHIETSKLGQPDELHQLETRLRQVIGQVKLAVKDWKPMLAKLDEASQALGDLGDRATRKQQQKFLEWLKDNHFTLLGYRHYRIEDTGDDKLLRGEADSGLGILSGEALTERARSVKSLELGKVDQISQSDALILTKTNARSEIHREGHMDYVGVLEVDEAGNITGEHRFIGLYTSSAINSRPWDIPYIREKVKAIIKRFGFDKDSHNGKAIVHIIETLPRDELLQSTVDELYNMVFEILNLQDRQRTHVMMREDRFKRFYSFLVHIPRDKFSTEVRHQIQDILKQAVCGDSPEFSVTLGESPLARLYAVVYVNHEQACEPDLRLIEEKIAAVVRSWEDELQSILVKKHGEDQGLALARRFRKAFPLAWQEDVSPWVTSFDVEKAAQLAEGRAIVTSLYRPRKKRQGLFRFKVFRSGGTLPLSFVLPILENLGLHVVSERPYELRMADGENIWIQDFDLTLAEGRDLDLERVRDHFQDAFDRIVNGEAENDSLNKLVIMASLDWRQVVVLRALTKYLRQVGVPFSQEYMEKALNAQPRIARALVELFQIRHDPGLQAMSPAQYKQRMQALTQRLQPELESLTPHQRDAIEAYLKTHKFSPKKQTRLINAVIDSLLDSVASQDEDRILRQFREAIMAVLRSNFYQPDDNGESKKYISFKFDSARVPGMPQPVPFREIFVYSPRVEAVHLRKGKVARGGLRWSDRFEDFRTEVLGLMKAQNVKNSIIVPVGAKGGFVAKQLPDGDRNAVMNEVIDCYKTFIRGMLDITDNLVDGQVVHPPAVIRHDEDDPYLVVAADKGTATFSDIANGISAEYNFWLGDAFASGGSAGYDHKAMGITAKGTWESVKRHFRELGVDCQSEDFDVVGIGDMGGDVFGNGMLLSKHIRLKAAFNHMHIFLDPNPDAAASWQERKRLFELPRSSWEDYDKSLISAGGGVFSRFDKTIPLSPEVKQWLGLNVDELPPQALIRELLKAPVDLLWNGGIGTYVKGSDESHNEVGDTANNALRVNGRELRCRVVGEGGNLGLTQKGRIEYARKGGKINTDFIDNSAGVDCSDHEVNIKILLKAMQEAGELDMTARNRLLEAMTDEVSALVLRNNYTQTEILSIMEKLSVERLGAKAHLIRTLEQRGLLDRELEFLPTDKELEQRQAEGRGLTRPELAVLLSYSKIALYEDLLPSDAPNDPYISARLRDYFPTPLRSVKADYLNNHRLHREIITTVLTSHIIDRMGATFMQRMLEDTGAPAGSIARAFTITENLFAAEDLWRSIESHDLKVKPDHQIDAALLVWRLVRQATRWMLNRNGHQLPIAELIEKYRPGVQDFMAYHRQFMPARDINALDKMMARLKKQGFADEAASALALMPLMHAALDVVDISLKTGKPVLDVAQVYFGLSERINLQWLRDLIEQLPVTGRWHAHARGALRDDLFEQHGQLATLLLEKYPQADGHQVVSLWSRDLAREVSETRKMIKHMRQEKLADYATVMVVVRTIRHLLVATRADNSATARVAAG